MGFSKKTKLAAAIYQGVELDGMHADHIKPRALGGSDDVTNCQILTPKANMQKGAHYQPEPREWQLDFYQKWDQHPNEPFLLNATPGAGKTDAALHVAQMFLQQSSSHRVFVVSPRVSLCRQWRDKAANYEIQLTTKDVGLGLPADVKGGAITYAALDSLVLYLRKFCYHHPSLIILDEPHHCGSHASWGLNVETAFGLVHERDGRILELTGTPFRQDCQKIPFVSYNEEGNCIRHKSYTYKDALKDGIVRHLVFKGIAGDVTLLDNFTNVTSTQEFHKEIDEDDASYRLRHILNPKGKFIPAAVSEIHAKLMALRVVIPDAKALILCMDQQHAVEVAKVIKAATGCIPAVIVSDSEKATTDIKAFQHSNTEYCVSVRQVSEGCDVPEFQVLGWFTNYRTEMFFIQGCGRIVRSRSKESPAPNEDAEMEDSSAYVFMPDDPKLIEMAAAIEDEIAIAIKELTEPEPRGPNDTPPQNRFSFIDNSSHGVNTLLMNSTEYAVADGPIISAFSTKMGVPIPKAAKYLSCFRELGLQHPLTQSVPQLGQATVLECEKDKWCNISNVAVKRLVAILRKRQPDIHWRDINKDYKPVRTMTLNEIKEKVADVNRRIAAELAKYGPS